MPGRRHAQDIRRMPENVRDRERIEKLMLVRNSGSDDMSTVTDNRVCEQEVRRETH